MGDPLQGPYSSEDHDRAVVLSAVFGWAGVTVMELRGADWWQFVGLLPFAAIIGLPLAYLVTWLVGGPILRRLMRRPVGWMQAAAWGAFIATFFAALSIVIGRLNGYRMSRDPTFDFWTAREVDGILTSYGWLLLAQNTAIFIALGAATGLAVRAVIGPGKTSGQQLSR